MKENFRIWYLTPYTITKQIGREYNSCIKRLNAAPGDWICIRDGDTLFTAPDGLWGKQLYDIVVRYGNKFALIGAMTNRLKFNHQVVDRTFSDNPDYNYHKKIGGDLYRDYYSDVKKCGHPIAGMFMLFSLQTWKKCSFSEEYPYYNFDVEFSRKLMEQGKVLGIAKGVYLFHDYRWGKEMPKHAFGHLLD